MAKDDAMMPQELEKNELEKVQRTKSKKGLEKAQKRDDIRAVMTTPQGRRFLWNVLGLTGMNSEALDLSNTNRQYFLSGKRSVGLDISEMVQEHAAQEYLTMIEEHMEKEENHDN